MFNVPAGLANELQENHGVKVFLAKYDDKDKDGKKKDLPN